MSGVQWVNASRAYPKFEREELMAALEASLVRTAESPALKGNQRGMHRWQERIAAQLRAALTAQRAEEAAIRRAAEVAAEQAAAACAARVAREAKQAHAVPPAPLPHFTGVRT